MATILENLILELKRYFHTFSHILEQTYTYYVDFTNVKTKAKGGKRFEKDHTGIEKQNWNYSFFITYLVASLATYGLYHLLSYRLVTLWGNKCIKNQQNSVFPLWTFIIWLLTWHQEVYFQCLTFTHTVCHGEIQTIITSCGKSKFELFLQQLASQTWITLKSWHHTHEKNHYLILPHL